MSMSACKQGYNFAPSAPTADADVFDAVTEHVQCAAGRRASASSSRCGAKARAIAWGHGWPTTACSISPTWSSWPEALKLPKPQVALAVLGLESGFETADAAVVGEQDILGDRLVRPRRAAQARRELHRRRLDEPRRPAISWCTSITASAASSGCRAIEAAGAPHDCLEIHYAGRRQALSCRSRTSNCCRATAPKRPAPSSIVWAAAAGRPARRAMKNRIREIANELIKIAAERQLREAPKLVPPSRHV